MINRRIFLLVIMMIFCFVLESSVQADEIYNIKLSELAVPGSKISPDLRGPNVADLIVVDDINQIENIENKLKREVVRPLADQFAQLGVVAFAAFTYPKMDNSIHQITLRIFLFDSEDSCSNWCQKKYQGDGWEKYYDLVVDVPYQSFHSKQMNKRVACFGNVWMTSGTIFDGNEPVDILQYYIQLIREK